jgi:tetratricopeptide (TPR) repeat protein
MAKCPKCGKPIPAGQTECPDCAEIPAHIGDKVVAHINLLKKKIQKDQSNPKLHSDLAELYRKNGVYIEALNEYLKILTIDPRHVEAQIKAAHMYLKLGKIAEAESAFHAALHLNPKSTECLIGLFRTYYLRGKTHEAITLGEKIVADKPNNVEFHVLLKKLYQQQGNRDKYLEELEKLESLAPDNEKVLQEITYYYKDENNIEKLLEYCHKMEQKGIEDIDISLHIGAYYCTKQRYGTAIKYITGVLKKPKIPPREDATLRAYLALAYLNKDKDSSATKLLNSMPQSHIQYIDEDLQRQLASLFFEAGQKYLQDDHEKDARVCLEKAVSLDPRNQLYSDTFSQVKGTTIINGEKIFTAIMPIAVAVVALISAYFLVARTWMMIHNRITIEVEPTAEITVMIDGNPVEIGTDTSGIISSPVMLIGAHTLEIQKSGYETWQGTVNIGPFKPAAVKIELIPVFYSLRLTSKPEDAAVMIDGQYAGTTPFFSDRVQAVPHVIEIEHEGHAPWRSTLSVTDDDSVNLGVIDLKNLTGKWKGRIGTDSYAYSAAFNMTVTQTSNKLSIEFYHPVREDGVYTGTIKGTLSSGEFRTEGSITYKYLKVFYWARTKEKFLIQGTVSNNWDRIEGTHYTEGLGEHDWWATRQ